MESKGYKGYANKAEYIWELIVIPGCIGGFGALLALAIVLGNQ